MKKREASMGWKLLLINPYIDGRVYTPSIGLLVLATTVRREMGISVRVLEPSLQGYSFQQVVEIAKDYFGGPHVTSMGSPFLKEYSFVDFMIRSDGEKALLGILRGSDYSNPAGACISGNERSNYGKPHCKGQKGQLSGY